MNNVNRYITKLDSYNFSDDVKKIFEEQIRSFLITKHIPNCQNITLAKKLN